MQGNNDSFDQKLNILQRIIEGVSQKLDKFQILISQISQNNAANLHEQSSQNLNSRTTYGGFKNTRDTSRVQIRPKEEIIVETYEHHEDQEIDRNRQANIRSASTRMQVEQPIDSRRSPPNAHPQILPKPTQDRLIPSSGQNTQPTTYPNTYPPPPLPPQYQHPGNGFIQQYHGYDPNNQPGRHNNWTGCICLMIWIGASLIAAAIPLIVNGAIQLDKYLNPDCPSPYTRSGQQCCYKYACVKPGTKDSYILPLIFLLLALVNGIVGILLLVKARKFYKDNNAPCCD